MANRWNCVIYGDLKFSRKSKMLNTATWNGSSELTGFSQVSFDYLINFNFNFHFKMEILQGNNNTTGDRSMDIFYMGMASLAVILEVS